MKEHALGNTAQTPNRQRVVCLRSEHVEIALGMQAMNLSADEN
jgi:hypothetical protein